MLFTERGRGLTEEKASQAVLPHVWMWTGVTQQDTAQTGAPTPRDGSPRRKLDVGQRHLPAPPSRQLGFVGQNRSVQPPASGDLP